MEITTLVNDVGSGSTFANYTLYKNKVPLLHTTNVNPCISSNLDNATRHAGNLLTDAIERKKNRVRDSFLATYFLLPFAMSTCGKAGSDVNALIKELAIKPGRE